MPYDHTVRIRFVNLLEQIQKANPQFLSSLDADDLHSLSEAVTQLETNIQTAQRNIHRR